MHINNNNYEIDTRQDEVLNQLQESLTEQERSIFFLELVGTVMADDVYHDSEKELIGKLAQILQKECDAYMRFLKTGNSAPPSELLAIAGVDPLEDATYEAAGELIGELIDGFIREVEGQRDKPQLVPLS